MDKNSFAQPSSAKEYLFSRKKIAEFEEKIAKYDVEHLPSKVDLRVYLQRGLKPVHFPNCVSNAVAGAYEYLFWRHRHYNFSANRLFILHNTLKIANKLDEEFKGCHIIDALKSLQQYGSCPQKAYDYERNSHTDTPYPDTYQEGQQFLIDCIERIPSKLDAWRSCLAEGYPIVFGLLLHPTFGNQRRKGLIPLPSNQEPSGYRGHAMLCVGYSDKDKVFIVRNYWGENWGDSGYCYIPYRYILNPRFNYGDNWSIRQFYPFVEDKSHWNKGPVSSVLNVIESEIARMSDKQYRVFLKDLGAYALEIRAGQLLLYAANCDGYISPQEYAEILDYLEDILEILGLGYLNTQQVVEDSSTLLNDKQLVESTVILLKRYLSMETLIDILIDIENIISADDLAPEEAQFIETLIRVWEIPKEKIYGPEVDEDEEDEFVFIDEEDDEYDFIDEEEEED